MSIFLNIDKSNWQPWSGWGPCSVSCGGGKQIRQRKCKPGTKGEDCSGDKTEERVCKENPCPSMYELSATKIKIKYKI